MTPHKPLLKDVVGKRVQYFTDQTQIQIYEPFVLIPLP